MKRSELKRDSDLELYPSSASQSLLSVNLDIENQPHITHKHQTDRVGDRSNEVMYVNLFLVQISMINQALINFKLILLFVIVA